VKVFRINYFLFLSKIKKSKKKKIFLAFMSEKNSTFALDFRSSDSFFVSSSIHNKKSIAANGVW